MRKLELISLLPLVAALTACDGWRADSTWSQGVWSDDGAQSAFVLNRFESRDPQWRFFLGADTRRNESLQIYTGAARTGDGLQPLGPIFEGRTYAHSNVFYMAQAGYVLVSRKVPIAGRQNENGSDFADFYVDRLGLDGSHLEVARATGIEMLSCDGGTSSSAMPGAVDAVPNYDGSLIALVESDPSCQGYLAQVTFLNSADLSVSSGPFTLYQSSSAPLQGMIEVAWTPNDNFMLGFWSFGGVSGNKISTSGQLTAINGVDMGCFYPRTSSGEWDSGHRTLKVSDQDTVEFVPSSHPAQPRPTCPL